MSGLDPEPASEDAEAPGGPILSDRTYVWLLGRPWRRQVHRPASGQATYLPPPAPAFTARSARKQRQR